MPASDMTESPRATAARRVESLVRRGCLRIRTLFDTALLGLDVESMQWFAVEPGELENVGAQLALTAAGCRWWVVGSVVSSPHRTEVP